MEVGYLGTHEVPWLGAESPLDADIPVCISRARLSGRATFPRATRRWLQDSAGFSALNPRELPDGFTDWDITPQQYVREVARYFDEIGMMDAAAPMDWMCETFALANTGLTVDEHLNRTVVSFLELRWLARRSSRPDLPIFPVLQGNSVDTYLRCADMYEAAGIDLTAEPLVGVGSVCRLQATRDIVDVFAALWRHFGGRIRLHGFGVKTLGLALVAPAVWSADSMAWSRRGREAGPCRHGLGHKSEANCPHFAMQWYRNMLKSAATTSPAAWEAMVEAYTARGEQVGLFAPLDRAAPNMPTAGARIARTMRMFLPEGADPLLAGQIDRFLDNLPENHAQ